jgi:hypothetical protein
MKYYISDIIPSIKRYSKKLDEDALLLNHDWVLFNDTLESRTNYIFRRNEELIITEKGIGKRTIWQNIGNQRLLIEQDGMLLQFNVFFDEVFLILNLNDTDTYAFLINENKLKKRFNHLFQINDHLDRKYQITQQPPIQEPKNMTYIVSYPSDKGILHVTQKLKSNYPEIGNNVTLNNKPAPDGEYKLGFMWYIHVKKGTISDISIF